VPLSDHEQKLLEQIEQALYAEDPKFAASVRKVKARPRGSRWIALSVLGVIVGLGLVLIGLLSANTLGIIMGIVGFVMIVASCAYGSHMLRRGKTDVAGAPGLPNSKPRDNGGLRGRMEDRLRRRFDEN
jgi:hypothetical protein